MNLSLDQLKRAVAIKEQIESLQSELNSLLGGRTENGVKPNRRGMSEAARAKIAAAQRARWAKTKGRDARKMESPKRRSFSPAARAKIAAAAKARWAKAKASGKNSL